jgi:glycosyltransferase involved in cell wall biosynthesis
VTAPRVRVAHVITKLGLGGAQETVLGLCAGLDATRFQVRVLCGPEVDEGGDMFGDFAQAGVDVEVVAAMGRSVRAVGDGRALQALCAALRRFRPEIVHTHTSKAGALGRIAARITRAPVTVHTVHGWSFGHGGGRYARAMIGVERLLARSTDRLVVVTPVDEATGLHSRIGNEDQYVLVRSGIDLDRFRFSSGARAAGREALGLGPDAQLVGTVGRLSEQKDPITLLRAFKRVVAERPSARLLMVGDGPLRAQVEQCVTDLALGAVVHLVGADHEPGHWYSSMDLFALSSQWEGLPRVALEAAASGLPVVSTRCGGLVELEARSAATLCAVGDEAELAASVESVLQAPGSLGARDEVPQWLEEYSVASMVADTAEMYEQLTRERLPA